MKTEPHASAPQQSSSTLSVEPGSLPVPQRLFLHEPGWRVALKLGSDRIFCYMMAPGQDFYHRLLDGELYIYHGDERICLECAARRGLLTCESLGNLRLPIDTGPVPPSPVSPSPGGSEFDLAAADEVNDA